MVYDAPLLNLPFDKRLDAIKTKLAEKPSKNIKFHIHTKCTGKAHLLKEMDEVLAKNGEGLMIKDPKCKYESRRSEKLLKVKKFEDAEATVLGHNKGSGRCMDMLGALRVRGDNGSEFKIGSGFDDA